MVTFTTNPLIAYEEEARKDYLARARSPIQASSSNPYGFAPGTMAIGNLLQGWLGGQAGRRAAKYKTAQEGAQSRVLAELLGAQTGVPGSEQYARGPMLVPTQDVQATGEYKRTPVGGDWQRVDIDDTGATVIDPAVLKTAGLSLGEYSILERKAKLAGAERSEAERISFAEKKLGEATTQKDRKYWLAQVDAIKAAVRALDKEPTPVQLSTSISSMVTKAASMSEAGESPETIAALVRSQMETFPDNQQMQDVGNAIIAASTPASREAAAGRIGKADVAKNKATYDALLEFEVFKGREDAAFVLAFGGGISMDIPISEQSKRLKGLRQSSELLTNLGTLGDMLKEGGAGVVGPLGAFRGFINVTLANFNPAVFSKDRATFEQYNKTARQSAMRVVSDENRFSDADRKFIFALFPKMGVIESPQQAAVKLDVLTAFFLRRFVQLGSLTQEQANAYPIVTLTPDKLGELLSQGLITLPEVTAIAPVLWPGMFK